jgi:hypothetical protein
MGMFGENFTTEGLLEVMYSSVTNFPPALQKLLLLSPAFPATSWGSDLNRKKW